MTFAVVWTDDIATDGPSSPRVRRGKGGFADMLTFWSTVPGFASLRHDTDGMYAREESDTYLTHACRHRWSRKSSMKIDGIGAFSQYCGFHPTSTVNESHSVG